MAVTNVDAGTLAAQPSTDDDALQLLVIELFFLLVGLVVARVPGVPGLAVPAKEEESKGKRKIKKPVAGRGTATVLLIVGQRQHSRTDRFFCASLYRHPRLPG